jgi:excisionase family DNA binding protein
MTKKIPQTQKSIPEGPFLSVAQSAGFLTMGKSSIRRLIAMGKLKKYKVGARTLIRRDDLLALVREG